MLPDVQPRLGDHREPLPPLLVEALELGLGGVSVDRGVDRFEIARDLLTLAARHVLEAVANEVHDAGLDGGLGEDRLDRLGEALEPVDAADQDVLDAALLEVGQDLHPEFRALGLLEPHAEHVAVAVDGDPERQVAGAALHRPVLADLQHQRVEEDHRVDVLQRPLRPRADVVHDRVGDLADQLAADLHPVDLLQVRLDVPRRQATRVQREDLVVEPHEPPLALADDLRLEAAVAIAGGVDRHPPLVADQRLGRRPIPSVARATGRLKMRLVAQMLGQLDLQRPLDQPLGQLRQHPARPGDLLLGPGAGQQLVDHLIGDLSAVGQLERSAQPSSIDRVSHELVAQHRPLEHRRHPIPAQGAGAACQPMRERRRLAWRLAAGAGQFRNPRSLE